MTRTENATKNMYTGIIYQLLLLIFRFITRTVFIKCLGSEYLGINGLFSNILTLLSMADLGIGASLVYSLYDPIAKGDKERQKTIIQYLKHIYIIIGIIIVASGICLIPFLKYLIKDEVNFVNLNIVFIIYVFQTASSYLFFPSKTEFLCANQKRYIYNIIANIMVIASNVMQIVVLFLFKNFILYLMTILFFNIIQAFLISKKTNKMFPFIVEKPTKKIEKSEKKNIFKDCTSLMIYRLNYVVLTATDNIIISKYLGLTIVGLYSNYVLITNSIVNLLATFFDSITAGIGNLHASTEKEKDYFIFKLINFITCVCFGIFAIGIYVLINDFILIWLGKEFLLSSLFVAIISINLYIEGLRKLLATYRTTYGLFRQAKLIPLFGMIVNIVVSIILVKRIGIFGVLIGTLISNLVTFMWFDPYIIYKKVFKVNPIKYYIQNIFYFSLFALMAFVCEFICEQIRIGGVLGFIVNGIICVILPLLLVCLIIGHSEIGKYLKELIFSIFSKIKRKKET